MFAHQNDYVQPSSSADDDDDDDNNSLVVTINGSNGQSATSSSASASNSGAASRLSMIKRPPDHLVEHSGWLSKRGRQKIPFVWKDRYFMLHQNQRLLYFKAYQSPTAMGEIFLHDSAVRLIHRDNVLDQQHAPFVVTNHVYKQSVQNYYATIAAVQQQSANFGPAWNTLLAPSQYQMHPFATLYQATTYQEYRHMPLSNYQYVLEIDSRARIFTLRAPNADTYWTWLNVLLKQCAPCHQDNAVLIQMQDKIDQSHLSLANRQDARFERLLSLDACLNDQAACDHFIAFESKFFRESTLLCTVDCLAYTTACLANETASAEAKLKEIVDSYLNKESPLKLQCPLEDRLTSPVLEVCRKAPPVNPNAQLLLEITKHLKLHLALHSFPAFVQSDSFYHAVMAASPNAAITSNAVESDHCNQLTSATSAQDRQRTLSRSRTATLQCAVGREQNASVPNGSTGVSSTEDDDMVIVLTDDVPYLNGISPAVKEKDDVILARLLEQQRIEEEEDESGVSIITSPDDESTAALFNDNNMSSLLVTKSMEAPSAPDNIDMFSGFDIRVPQSSTPSPTTFSNSKAIPSSYTSASTHHLLALSSHSASSAPTINDRMQSLPQTRIASPEPVNAFQPTQFSRPLAPPTGQAVHMHAHSSNIQESSTSTQQLQQGLRSSPPSGHTLSTKTQGQLRSFHPSLPQPTSQQSSSPDTQPKSGGGGGFFKRMFSQPSKVSDPSTAQALDAFYSNKPLIVSSVNVAPSLVNMQSPVTHNQVRPAQLQSIHSSTSIAPQLPVAPYAATAARAPPVLQSHPYPPVLQSHPYPPSAPQAASNPLHHVASSIAQQSYSASSQPAQIHSSSSQPATRQVQSHNERYLTVTSDRYQRQTQAERTSSQSSVLPSASVDYADFREQTQSAVSAKAAPTLNTPAPTLVMAVNPLLDLDAFLNESCASVSSSQFILSQTSKTAASNDSWLDFASLSDTSISSTSTKDNLPLFEVSELQVPTSSSLPVSPPAALQSPNRNDGLMSLDQQVMEMMGSASANNKSATSSHRK